MCGIQATYDLEHKTEECDQTLVMNLVWKLPNYSHRHPPLSNGNGNGASLANLGPSLFYVPQFEVFGLSSEASMWSLMQPKDVIMANPAMSVNTQVFTECMYPPP